MAASVTALAVVLLALAPGLGILLLVTAVPALLVTELHARRRWRRGLPMSGLERVGCIAFWIVFLPVVLAVTLFIAVCVLFVVGGLFR